MKQAIVVVVVLVVGIGALAGFVVTRPQPEKLPPEQRSILVETMAVERGPQAVSIPASGIVRPAEQIDLQAEVGGRIVWMSEHLVPGARFVEGEVLLKIDPRDYQVAVEQQVAAVERARLDLELERGRKAVAEREWELLNGSLAPDARSPEGAALALRGPQLATAQVGLAAAESGLRRARLNLERTTVRAPFNGFVESESVDVGQLLSPGVRLGSLVGSDRFWILVSVPVEQLGFIRLPNEGEDGAAVRVRQELDGWAVVRTGRVIRLLGDVDPVGRMARLLVEVEDPFGPVPGHESAPPLLLGSFVQVEIEGGTMEQVVELPREALRDGDRVFVHDEGGRLAIRPVEVAWRRAESVLIRSGVTEGDRVVTSRVPTPIAGMRLRVANGENAAAAAEPMKGQEVATP